MSTPCIKILQILQTKLSNHQFTAMLKTILLLVLSNIFMTFAWYGHLKQTGVPLWKAIVVSWGIAFFEYCLMVPANRAGYANGFSGFQLKIAQELVTLLVFTVFAILYLKEPFHYKYLISFLFILGAVYFAFKK
jgi:uncharacterized protein (DUF486 family)